MPKPRPEFLQRDVSRHGRVRWYVRIKHGKKIRIRGEYGSPEFLVQYDAAIAGKTLAPTKGKVVAGTLEWLYDQYRDSTAWTDRLAASTQYQRTSVFRSVIASAGNTPLHKITTKSIALGIERRSKTPIGARHFLDAMRGLFEWAVKAQHVDSDPTIGLKPPEVPTTTGFAEWSEEDVQRYEARWPLGTRQRVWLAVLLYTGLRRSDAVRVGRQHIRNGEIVITPEKTSRNPDPVQVTIPILPPLREALDAGPTGDLAFICGARGDPLTKGSFGNDFKAACRAGGINLDGKAAHGLRKLGAIRAAMNGATVPQLNAIFGWVGARMALHYTQKADRIHLSRASAHKLLRTPDEQSRASPYGEVRPAREK